MGSKEKGFTNNIKQCKTAPQVLFELVSGLIKRHFDWKCFWTYICNIYSGQVHYNYANEITIQYANHNVMNTTQKQR